MSDFFNLSTGESAISESGSFETQTKLPNIPDNTDVLGAPDEAKWDTDFNKVNHIKIRWNILSPKEHAGRKITQKIWVTDDKPKSKNPDADRDKSKQMLMAIDKNAGGHIAKAGVMPTDESLTRFLTNKMMVLKVMEYEFDVVRDDGKTEVVTGNWIAAVSPKKTQAAPTPQAAPPAPVMDEFDKDIPF